MKKILAGCLIVVLIALVGFSVAGYYAYRVAKPMLQNAGDYVARARDFSRLGDRIANKQAYDAPANGELTQAQLDRFLAVQARVRSELGPQWTAIEQKSTEIRRKTEGNEHLSFSEVTSIFSDLANIYTDARRVQVIALNTQKFSEAEYDWVRRRVWEAAGMNVARGIDMSAIEELAKQGTITKDLTVPPVPLPEVPKKNIELVQPHLGNLKDWLPMAMLGL